MQQYEYGLKTGMSLQMIHSVPTPISESWETFFNRKINKKRALYEASPIKHSKDYLFLDYIEKTRNLRKGRPSVYQHGDFHIKNMIVGNDDNLYSLTLIAMILATLGKTLIESYGVHNYHLIFRRAL